MRRLLANARRVRKEPIVSRVISRTGPAAAAAAHPALSRRLRGRPCGPLALALALSAVRPEAGLPAELPGPAAGGGARRRCTGLALWELSEWGSRWGSSHA